MNILLLEDDRKLAESVRKGLEAQGFVVTGCNRGDEAHALATSCSFDALVLDIMVPGRDGLDILRSLRAGGSAVPVVLVTARGALDQRIEGLNLGADDYLAKPFYVDELAARLHAVIRRVTKASAAVLQNGDVAVNLVTREVTSAGVKVELTVREFALLAYLLGSPGRVFTRAQICEHVWNYHFDPGTNLVDVYIQRLRKKLGGDPEHPVIVTVRGVGYRVRAAPEAGPAVPSP